MTIIGDFFGYDRFGNDIMGINKHPGSNCVECGLSSYIHTIEMNNKCLMNIYNKDKNEICDV